MRWVVWSLVAILTLALVYFLAVSRVGDISKLIPESDSYSVEITDYHPPTPPEEELFQDDDVSDKHPKFDPSLVDSRPEGAWLVNLSEAITRLDAPMILPDSEGDFLKLKPSYAQAIQAYEAKFKYGRTILPSINMIDGKAKQFDDGLYAAIDLAYYQGVESALVGHKALVTRMLDKLDPKSPAAPFLAAALELAGTKREVPDTKTKEDWLRLFDADQVRSKPAGFYTWNDQLKQLFRVLRFLQQPIEKPVAQPLADLLKANPDLNRDYEKAVGFFERLTNPRAEPSLLDLVKDPSLKRDPAFFPPSTTKESELFKALFPLGLPANANLMKEMVKSIKSGKVNLAPKPGSGWYDYQVHALETMLLPEKGAESEKLLLTKTYKKRMLEAFQALLTKRRETHYRNAETAKAAAAAPPPAKLGPRLRLEPAPTFYLRTARAYDFLAHLLESSLGDKTLKSLHGLKADGKREKDLKTELNEMRELFYGCYLLSAEDIGLKPELLKDEPVDRAKCMKFASDWLSHCTKDADLAVDTRVIVPVYASRPQGIVRCWGTLGVRMAKLDAKFVTPPSIKEAKGSGDWSKIEIWKLTESHYVIPVDEFAEIELKGVRVLNREEFREACDKAGTKEAIVESLSR